ncbi:MAG: cytochrome ubiquinol oxidase subunit I [Terriglobia bacterium]
MSDPLFWHRLQFGFTVTFHYIFPQLTMGLALLVLVMKTIAYRTKSDAWNQTARFWIRIFGLSFAMGVVTGVPMEFQFGTNWAVFSEKTGGVIGQTLAMEGIFAFFLESSFLAALLWGERRLGPFLHYLAAVALYVGSWLSGYFIIATNAFMQHPVGHSMSPDGTFQLARLAEFVFNPWAMRQYLHNQMAAAVTGAFVMSAVGAFWELRRQHRDAARISLQTGILTGVVAASLVAFPTGHLQGRILADYQPVTLAAMEGHFEGGRRASIALIGQPNLAERKLDNPIQIPAVLSWLAYGNFSADVRGLTDFPENDWPTNIELLYYAFHIMVGLGTLFIGVMAIATFLLLQGRLWTQRWMLWILGLAFPFPFIANTAGWMTAELGRQPWLVYGLMRTEAGGSPTVHGGATLFTALGFAGLYFVLGVLFLALVAKEIGQGPHSSTHASLEGTVARRA